MSVFYGIDECGSGWAEASLVEKVDGVGECFSRHDTVDVLRCGIIFKFDAP
jgi:hypothetical protein